MVRFGVRSLEFGVRGCFSDLRSPIFDLQIGLARFEIGAISAGLKNERNVRFPVFVQRRRHADDHGLNLFNPAEVGGRRELPSIYHLPYPICTYVLDVALSAVQQLNLFGIDINAENCHARASKLDRER